MIESLLARKVEKRPAKVQLEGRILFLAEDPALVRAQIEGDDLDLNNISRRSETIYRPTR